MRARRTKARRGGALIVALVMLVVVAAMVELMIAAPNAELVRGRSALAKESSLACADVGVREAAAWLTTTGLAIDQVVHEPQYGFFEGVAQTPLLERHDTVVFSQAEGPPVSRELGSPLAARQGAYPFPGDPGADGFGPDCFRHFGDRASRGEYAFRIASLGKGYFEVAALGRTSGVTAHGGSSAPMVTRVRATLYVQFPLMRDFAAVIFAQAGRDRALAFGTAPGMVTTRGAPGIALNGKDTKAKLDQPGLVLPPHMGLIVMDPSGGKVEPRIERAPKIEQTSFIEKLVAAAAATASALPGGVGEPPPTAKGSRFDAARWSGMGLVSGSRLAEPGAVPAATYLKIDDHSSVSGPIFNFEGPPAATSGLIVIDVGDDVTFDATPLFRFVGDHDFQGSVIFFQRGDVKLATNTLVLAESKDPKASQPTAASAVAKAQKSAKPPEAQAKPSGKPNGLFQFQASAVKKSLGFWRLQVKVASFVILQ